MGIAERVPEIKFVDWYVAGRLLDAIAERPEVPEAYLIPAAGYDAVVVAAPAMVEKAGAWVV
jgi:hypothetical protein